MVEKLDNANVGDKILKLGETLAGYKDAFMSQCKNVEVDVKNWNVAVGKMDKEYTVEVNVKLGMHSKDTC